LELLNIFVELLHLNFWTSIELPNIFVELLKIYVEFPHSLIFKGVF